MKLFTIIMLSLFLISCGKKEKSDTSPVTDRNSNTTKSDTKKMEIIIKPTDSPSLATQLKNCKKGNMEGCQKAGTIYCSKKENRCADGKKLLIRACNNNFFKACDELGLVLLESKNSSENLKRGVVTLLKACEWKYSKACLHMGKLYVSGTGVELNYSKALNFFEKGCNFGGGESCYNAAVQYGRGVGAKKNHEKSMKLLKLSCKYKFQKACTMEEKAK